MTNSRWKHEIDEALLAYAQQLDEGSSGIGYHLDYLDGIAREDITTSLVLECMNIAANSTGWNRDRHQLLMCIPLSDGFGTDFMNFPSSIECAIQENMSCCEPPSIVLCLKSDYINGKYSGIKFQAEVSDEYTLNMTNKKYAFLYSAYADDQDDLAAGWNRSLICICQPGTLPTP